MMRYGNYPGFGPGFADGGSHWGLRIVAALFVLVVLGALAWIIVTLARLRTHRAAASPPAAPLSGPPPPDARRILDERLARGEISVEDYRQLRRVIEGPT